MADRILYKYLDAKGGLAMLEHHNLQFTNATQFNDPFDCHPALFDCSKPPANERNWPPADFPKDENATIGKRRSAIMKMQATKADEIIGRTSRDLQGQVRD